LIEEAVMAVGGVGVESDVRKNRKFRELLFQSAECPINNPFGIEGLFGVGGA
jgi:hypothetical protein